MKNKILFFFALIMFNGCSQDGKENNYRKLIAECDNLKLALTEQSDNACIACYMKLINSYPDSALAYSFLINEYQYHKEWSKVDSLIDKFIAKFGATNAILIQRNVISYSKDKKVRNGDLDNLISRFDEGELTKSETFDLAVLLTISGNKKDVKKLQLTQKELDEVNSISKGW